MQLFTGIARAFQLLFTVVVLGLSVSLARAQGHGSVPAQTGYAAFAGALGVLVSLVGIAALFIESLSGIIAWALDAFASIALLVGGIIYAVALKGVNCSKPEEYAWDNVLVSGGCEKYKGDKYCYTLTVHGKSAVKSHCISAEADTAFMFLGFLACLAALVVGFLTRRS
ncbi:hypothetical protein N7540_004674 [Penicillium herquei]|nr:hypothetical protein N7540_004674 [Penicillium herquei]